MPGAVFLEDFPVLGSYKSLVEDRRKCSWDNDEHEMIPFTLDEVAGAGAKAGEGGWL